jgi:hypothetical protein
VFASRSPFRPNAIGLSCVRLERVEQSQELGPILWVAGADLMDGTPIYDIKPYLPYSDCQTDAAGGFTDRIERVPLEVEFPAQWLEQIPQALRAALAGVLAQDPRPSYQDDPERVYGMAFGGFDVKFTVEGRVLTVRGVTPL